VVIHQINIENVTLFEPEYDAPVTGDADAPISLHIAMGQHIDNALELIRLDLTGVPVLKQTL
jgi:hypothetical protein